MKCPEFVAANDRRLPDDVRLRLLGQVAYLLAEGDCPHTGSEPPQHCPNPVVAEHLTSVQIRQSVHNFLEAEKPVRWLKGLQTTIKRNREQKEQRNDTAGSFDPLNP